MAIRVTEAPVEIADWQPTNPSRAADFERRAALYAGYDAQLFEYTRFFAAASSVNAVLAKLFAMAPAIPSPRCFEFLTKVGTALETSNRVYARSVGRGASGSAQDLALVSAEQKQLQRYVESEPVQRGRHWPIVRDELNRFLNERYAGSTVWRWWAGSGSFSRVLRDVRAQMGTLDFATECHRVAIGLKLIEHIRGATAKSRAASGRAGGRDSDINAGIRSADLDQTRCRAR